MKKEDKSTLVKELAAEINEFSHFYVADSSGLDAGATSDLRRLCFGKDVKMMVVKNTLFRKALEQIEGDYEELYSSLVGSSTVFFSNVGNAPAKLIKDFSRAHKKPVFKCASVEQACYVGENQLDFLTTIKSKEELIGDIVALLQSPAKNVISALKSGGSTIHGVLQTLSEK